MVLLPFMIGDKIPDEDQHWNNFLRLIQITVLVISPIASDDTVNSLTQLIYEHNLNFKELYPDVDFTPKLHFMTHFPDQIKKFGPGRNHWCVRFEAKHNLFKSRKWKNFRAIEKSTAFFHQRWMCLQQLSGNGEKSEVYLYEGDSVKQGITVLQEQISEGVKRTIESTGIVIPHEVMRTGNVSIHGISYSINNVIVIDNNAEEPTFGMIRAFI
ncbi:unnamed protein product [Mytilus edulis]|uniref:Uncharacterized protein n=1 Tax=Mytilus edulis TaxID=6550 RepID=A0A8S3SEG6_MYTED|nr:unnamed protein product [Mytilus edulis]